MELSEVKQLTHKIVKIDIDNKNFHSLYEDITQKITLTDVKSDEVVRFSLEQNSNFIQHQSIGSDYYIIIPNNLNSITSIYAHYFPDILYEYEEDTNISYNFDFTSLLDDEPINNWGNTYPVMKSQSGYKIKKGNKEGSLQVQSTLDRSVDGYKNPNYKNFTKTNVSNSKDMTEQGYFPLSSRYRNNINYLNIAPSVNANPVWTKGYNEIKEIIEPPLNNINDVVIFNRPELIEVKNNTLISHYSTNRRGKAYIKQGWQNHKKWKISFQVYTPNNSQYSGYILVKHPENNLDQSNQLQKTIGFRSNGAVDVFDDLNIINRVGINSAVAWNGYLVDIILEKDDNHYKATLQRGYQKQVFEFDWNGFNNLNETENLTLILTVTDNFYGSDIELKNIKYEYYYKDYSEDSNPINIKKPYWQVRINRDGLSPFISETEDRKYSPMKLDLNYNYLPTSTHYHQHFYGLEGNCPKLNDIFVFEGTNIKDVNNHFGSDNNYRIIERTNPYDDTHSMHVDHECICPLNDLDKSSSPLGYITKNKCYNYYVYKAIGNETPKYFIKLNKDELYSLKYFIFIPGKLDDIIKKENQSIESYDCYLSINGQRIENEFLKYDRSNRNKWIYHEIPFYATGDDYIEIVGPKNNSNIVFFLTHVEIEKFISYSPTLNYTEKGLSVTESLNENDFCSQTNKKLTGTASRSPSGSENAWVMRAGTNLWQKRNKLPNPQGDVLFTLNDDVEIYYDMNSTDLYYSHLDTYPYELEYDVNYNLKQHNFEETYLEYDDTTGDLSITYPRNIRFFKGPNNRFTLKLTDSTGDNPINRGDVEVDFISSRVKDQVGPALAYAGKKSVPENGILNYTRVNLSNLELNKNKLGNDIATEYYMRIKYTDSCIEGEPIYDYKLIWVEPPNIELTPLVNDNYKNTRYLSYDKNGKPVYGKDCEAFIQAEYFEETDMIGINEFRNPNSPETFIDDDGNKIYKGKWGHYNILNKSVFTGTTVKKGDYYVYNTDEEFPLKVSVDVFNRTSTGTTTMTDGGERYYCELSIDDKVFQTTIVDTAGIADFYLTLEDVPLKKQTIKIECYDSYWHSITYIYFDLIICEDALKIRPKIPITLREINTCNAILDAGYDEELKGISKCIFTNYNKDPTSIRIPQDDTFILDLDWNPKTDGKKYQNFKLSVYRHKKGYNNINKFTDKNSTLIHAEDMYGPRYDILLFFSLGLNFNTYCNIHDINEKSKDKHPTTTSSLEKQQIENLIKKIEDHGISPTKTVNFNKTIQQLSNIKICPETMCELLLYAPIINVENVNNKTVAILDAFYRNNTPETVVYYSIVTGSLDGDDKYRQNKKTFAIHYMNYIQLTKNNDDCEITWKNKSTKPMYEKINGIWIPAAWFKVRVGTKYVSSGRLEVYFNGKLEDNIAINDNDEFILNSIPSQKTNDSIQLRYVFGNGYNFVTYPESED